MSRRLTSLAVPLAIALLAVGCSSGGGESSVVADRGPSGEGASTNVIEIATVDGEMLAATASTVNDAVVTVVLAHMRGADRSTWDPIIGDLNDAGYATLAFDFRGYGDSTGARDTSLDVDLAAAVGQARSDGAAKVVVVGASMGGTAVLATGADLGVDGAVAISAPGRFLGLDGFAGASAFDIPILLIDSENDQPYVADLAKIAADTDTSLVTFTGSAHGTAIFRDHDAEITAEILSYIDLVATASSGY